MPRRMNFGVNVAIGARDTPLGAVLAERNKPLNRYGLDRFSDTGSAGLKDVA
jgi:hypothetical protein